MSNAAAPRRLVKNSEKGKEKEKEAETEIVEEAEEVEEVEEKDEEMAHPQHTQPDAALIDDDAEDEVMSPSSAPSPAVKKARKAVPAPPKAAKGKKALPPPPANQPSIASFFGGTPKKNPQTTITSFFGGKKASKQEKKSAPSSSSSSSSKSTTTPTASSDTSSSLSSTTPSTPSSPKKDLPRPSSPSSSSSSSSSPKKASSSSSSSPATTTALSSLSSSKLPSSPKKIPSPSPSSSSASSKTTLSPKKPTTTTTPSSPSSSSSSSSSSSAKKPSRVKKVIEADEDFQEEKERTSKKEEEESSDEEEETGGQMDVDDEEEDEVDMRSIEEKANGYEPVKDASWKKGQKVPYAALADLFDRVSQEPSRLKVVSMVSDLFRSVIALSPDQLLPTVYLLCNRIAPAYEGKELGVGDAVLMKAVAETTGSSLAQLKEQLKQVGDLGDVAERSRGKQKTLFTAAKLTVPGVYKNLVSIANASGKGSGDRKRHIIKAMLVACVGTEAKYLIRSLQGNLRIGLAEKGVISGLSRALTLTPPNSDITDIRQSLSRAAVLKQLEDNDKLLKQAIIEVPSFDAVIPAVLQHGVKELPNQCHLTAGIPVQVMLGKPAKGIDDIVKRFANALFTLEFKYDGERAQIHLLEDGTIRIYSRNSENNTSKYPDIIQRLPHAYDPKEVKSFIIDCEAVAWSKTEERIMPFQVLSTRKRKDVNHDEVTVQVCLFAFDIIYLNGQSLLNESFSKRRQLLHDNFHPVTGEFQFAKYKDTSDLDEVQDFLKEAIESSCEGLMVKTLDVDATYVPSKRNWIKIKKDYLAGGDTFDLVPIGAWLGKGKRTGAYGAFLLATYDEETEEYQSICKIGTGFSEEKLEEHTKFLQQHEIPGARKYYVVGESLTPDVWFEPCQVWEVLAADLSISPVHKAAIGKVHESKGIGLRFPRFVRIRDDKKPEQATSAEQIAEMYANQSAVSNKRSNRD